MNFEHEVDWSFCNPHELVDLIASIRQKFIALQILHHAKVHQQIGKAYDSWAMEVHDSWVIFDKHYQMVLKDVGLIPDGTITSLLEVFLRRPGWYSGHTLLGLITLVRQNFVALKMLYHAKIHQLEERESWAILNRLYEQSLNDIGLIPNKEVSDLLEMVLWRPGFRRG